MHQYVLREGTLNFEVSQHLSEESDTTQKMYIVGE